MIPHLCVIDDFLPAFQLDYVKTLCEHGTFKDIVSPTDGITYPGILKASEILKELLRVELMMLFKRQITPGECFFRLTSAGQAPAPNKIHNDASMGTHALLLYVNKVWPDGAGTSFWLDCDGDEGQTLETDANFRQLCTNARSMWTKNGLVQGKENRALIYDARLWHCAEPVGGFGSDKTDGRIVLTLFFTI